MSGPVASTANQVDQIMAVMDTAFDPAWGEAWNHRQVADALLLNNTHAFLVDENGRELDYHNTPNALAAGFVLARYAPDEAELLLIGVRPEFRRRGLGEALIDQLRQHARALDVERIFLEMRENNPAAHLYGKIGFSPIGRRKAYYSLSDGSRMDAITYGLSI